jgi:hypothetical protein
MRRYCDSFFFLLKEIGKDLCNERSIVKQDKTDNKLDQTNELRGKKGGQKV